MTKKEIEIAELKIQQLTLLKKTHVDAVFQHIEMTELEGEEKSHGVEKVHLKK